MYVNDILIIGTPSKIDQVISEIREHFVLKDMGRVTYLLGMDVQYEPGVLLCLSQTAYIDHVASFSNGTRKISAVTANAK